MVFAPLLIQALSIVKPRAGQDIPECLLDTDGGEALMDLMDQCVDYGSCSEKGYKNWNTLQTRLSQEQHVCDKNEIGKFRNHYVAQYASSTTPDESLLQALANRGIEETEIDGWAVSGRDPDSLQKDRSRSYYNLFDTHNGVIVAKENFRVSDSQKKLPWSEIVYQTWALAAKKADELASNDKSHLSGGPIRNLRSIVQHFIVNEDTNAVIEAAYKANDLTPGRDDPEQWNEWTEQNTEFFFFALLGTANVRGALWLLHDHAQELGQKEITAIYTRWSDSYPDIW